MHLIILFYYLFYINIMTGIFTAFNNKKLNSLHNHNYEFYNLK